LRILNVLRHYHTLLRLSGPRVSKQNAKSSQLPALNSGPENRAMSTTVHYLKKPRSFCAIESGRSSAIQCPQCSTTPPCTSSATPCIQFNGSVRTQLPPPSRGTGIA